MRMIPIKPFNILYIYGLDGKLSRAKESILENFGKVFTPDIDYYTDLQSIQSILVQMENIKVDAVIGSSMGGFAGYYISTILDVPALLFNPALEKRSVEQDVPVVNLTRISRKKFLLGAKDDVINPGDTLRCLSRCYNDYTDFHLHILPGLTHNIPVEIFRKEVGDYFKNYFDY